MKQYQEAYTAMKTGLALKSYAGDKWEPVVKDLRALVTDGGLAKGKNGALKDLRSRVKSASKGEKFSAGFIEGAGTWGTNGTVVDGVTAQKLGSLKLLYHTYSLTSWGSHKLWIVSTPKALREWPIDAYKDKQILTVKASLADLDEQFSEEDKKNLSKATQEGTAWCQKAMVVAGNCLKGKGKGIEFIKRWFADEDNQTEEKLAVIANKLNDGFKKMASAMAKGQVVLTDVPQVRGDDSSGFWKSEALAWTGSGPSSGLRVVYIESAFFSDKNVLKGKKNWTRIIVHEMTHVELATDDHRYAWHQLGMKPKKDSFSTATCLTNAESWAFFAADCAGQVDEGTLTNVLKA